MILSNAHACRFYRCTVYYSLFHTTNIIYFGSTALWVGLPNLLSAFTGPISKMVKKKRDFRFLPGTEDVPKNIQECLATLIIYHYSYCFFFWHIIFRLLRMAPLVVAWIVLTRLEWPRHPKDQSTSVEFCWLRWESSLKRACGYF